MTVELLASIALLWLFIAGVQRLAAGELSPGNPAGRLAGLFSQTSGPVWPVGTQEETDPLAWAPVRGGSASAQADATRPEMVGRHPVRSRAGGTADASARWDVELIEGGVCPVPVAPLERPRVHPRRTMARSA
jgi:hypothetical protein